MITVRFNEPEEFVAELNRGKPNDNILRLTKMFEQSKIAPGSICYVSVIGTYVRDGQLIKLSAYCGDNWRNGPERKAMERAEKVMTDLEQVARELGIEVRAGIYEETQETK